MQYLSRIEPLGNPGQYRTFQFTSPIKTHFRPAKNCAEVNCANYLNGWKTILDESTTQGQYHAETIKQNRKRFKYTVIKLPTGLTEYTFEPGQNCFGLSDHKVRLERPQRHFIRDGDYRRFGSYVELRADQWQEEFDVHQDNVKTRMERG